MPPARSSGRDVCDVLMTGPGPARSWSATRWTEVAAGRVWTATVAGGSPRRGAVRDPLGAAGRPRRRRAGDRPAGLAAARPSWLSEAAARIGSTLDLTQTASEVVDVAVPGFADAAAIYGAERLLAADELTSPRAGHGAVVRRLAARLRGQPRRSPTSLLRPGEVLVFGEDTPHSRAMATGEPVLFDQLDGETAERIARRPGGREIIAGYTSFLAVPLIARGVGRGVRDVRAGASQPGVQPR